MSFVPDDICCAETIRRFAFSVISLLFVSSGKDIIINGQVSLGCFTTVINFKCYKCPKGEIQGNMEAYDIYS